jgi:hypothetical protein
MQVGVLTMAGKGVELLVSPTDDIGKLLSCLHNVRVRVRPSLVYYLSSRGAMIAMGAGGAWRGLL